MNLTLTEKIIQKHLADPTAFEEKKCIERGTNIAIRIDQTLTQDATGTMTYLQFETIGIPRVKTEVSVSYIDHNTLQGDYKNMDDHRYLQSIAEKYGIWFSRCGNGICHQVHLERFGIPGKTLLGSDSHTPTGGALGMIAIGAGGLDVAVAMGGGAFHLAMPRVIGVHLTGMLKKGVSAKDLILEILRRQTVKGGVGAVYEYYGQGLNNLTVPQRATITNMGAELGATCSIFPSDTITRAFLSSMGRESVWQPLEADTGCTYDAVIEIDLGTLEPLAACPHSPDAVKPVRELAGIPVHQVVIGSCTNSSLDDLAAVAAITKGKHIAPQVEAGIAPGSRTTLLLAEKAGILGELIRAGFRILESSCGPCIGMGFAPNSEGVSLRTFNRNFKGRSGTDNAQMYLVSPETAAVSAITGVFADPSQLDYSPQTGLLLGTGVLSAEEIHTCTGDDGMLIAPLSAEKSAQVVIERGPNIKPCPQPKEPKENFTLPVLLKTANNVSTDDIMPAGAKVLPLRSNIPEISKFTFERLDNTFYDRAGAVKDSGCIVVGGENYGQGSSREHAALAPMYLGVRMVLAKSFARIHQANLINYGILPVVFTNPADYDRIARDEQLTVENCAQALAHGIPFRIKQESTGYVFEGKTIPDERSRRILAAGGLAAYTRMGGQ